MVKNKPNRPLNRLINHFNKDAPPLRYTTFDNISCPHAPVPTKQWAAEPCPIPTKNQGAALAVGAAITIVAIQNATDRQIQVTLQQWRIAYGQIKGQPDTC